LTEDAQSINNGFLTLIFNKKTSRAIAMFFSSNCSPHQLLKTTTQGQKNLPWRNRKVIEGFICSTDDQSGSTATIRQIGDLYTQMIDATIPCKG